MNALKGRELNKWLILEAKKWGKVLEARAAEFISFNCGNQLRDLHNELEKLVLYSGRKNHYFGYDGKVITKSSEGNIFSLVDNLSQKKEKKP